MQKTEKNIISKFVHLFKDEYFWYENNKNEKAEVFYTDNVAEITGYSKEELNTMPGKGKDIIYSEDLQALKKLLNEFKDDLNNNWLEIEFRIMRKDKQIVWVNEIIFVNRNKEGKIEESFGRVYNISAYKEKENNLFKEVDELQKINVSKDNFIAMLSHDLRAPLATVQSCLDVIIGGFVGDINDRQRRSFAIY